MAPAYDLMSTVIHSPHVSDKTLNLYPEGFNAAYYLANGHYGHENFMEPARQPGVVETRGAKIPDQFAKSKAERTAFITLKGYSMILTNIRPAG